MSPSYIEQLAKRIRRHVPSDVMPQGDLDALFLSYAALALAKGRDVSRQDVHNSWAAWMASQHPSHESIKPFDELDEETRQEDDPYVAAIRRALEETADATASQRARAGRDSDACKETRSHN
jgi:hypothetical protein